MSTQAALEGKRILFALCGFELGGAERQALHLARYLKEQGCRVSVLGHHHHYPGREAVIECCEAAGIPWTVQRFRWPCGKVALLRDCMGLLRVLYRERPDVVLPYTTWPNIGCNFVARWAPVGLTVWGQRDVAPLQGHWIERAAYRRAAAVICNAQHEVAHLQLNVGETAAPLFVVHNGIDMEPCLATRAGWRARLGIGPDAVVATMLANFRRDKDHATVLHAWRRLLDSGEVDRYGAHLVLAGAPQEAHDDVRQLATRLALGETVSFPGHVKDVAGLLRASDIGVLMTGAEGLSNAVLETMASGLPVLATDVPGNREALGDGKDHPLCQPGDVEGLAAQLRLLLGQPALRERLGTCNRERAAEAFSLGVMCRDMTSIIVDLLESRGPQHRGRR